jgi:hypothetical protein
MAHPTNEMVLNHYKYFDRRNHSLESTNVEPKDATECGTEIRAFEPCVKRVLLSIANPPVDLAAVLRSTACRPE